jgi:cytochrome c2
MLRRSILKFAVSVLATLLAASPALAGGWAVVTLDQLPGQIVAGQPLDVGFTVRQHGQTLRSDLQPILRFDRTDAQGSFTVSAQQTGGDGHYNAVVTFPSSGTWNWQVDVGLFTPPMPALTVIAAAPAPAASGISPLTVLGVLGLVGAVGALLVSLRTRARWAVALVVVAVLVSVTGFASATNEAARTTPAGAPLAPVELGRALFLAKGCVMCHQHAAVRAATQFEGANIGPDLTQPRFSADYLHKWLKDPSSVKPNTQMPTLGLSDSEIDALAGFLTSK